MSKYNYATEFAKKDIEYFNQMLTFNSFFFAQEMYEIWYPGCAIIKVIRYQIMLANCTKWPIVRIKINYLMKSSLKIWLHVANIARSVHTCTLS